MPPDPIQGKRSKHCVHTGYMEGSTYSVDHVPTHFAGRTLAPPPGLTLRRDPDPSCAPTSWRQGRKVNGKKQFASTPHRIRHSLMQIDMILPCS